MSEPIDLNSSLQGNVLPSIPNIQYLHESDASASGSLHGLCVYFINIQCLFAHLAELSHHLETLRPHVVCINETWLDESRQIINIDGYEVCSRRDRHAGANRGGILTLRREDFHGLVHICNSEVEERSWHYLKLGVETILLGNWYRPGASVFDGHSALYSELAEHFQEVSGVLLVGDLNIHHKRWLRFSNDNSQVGAAMKTLCDFHGMSQLVREPTRNDYLLDLAICDIPGAEAKVLSKIADHQAVRIDIPMPVIKEVCVSRTVWCLQKANWKELKKELVEVDWSQLSRGCAEDAVEYFLDVVWTLLVKHIQQKRIETKRSSHPWLNSRCRAAIIRKNTAEGTDSFPAAQLHCDTVLREERAKYVEALKQKLATLSRSSKQWWKINRELLHRKATVASIPPLREDAQWLTNAKDKANAFAKTFSAKNALSPEVVDTPFFVRPDDEMQDFVAFRTPYTKNLFRKLDESKAIDNDRISAAMVKRLAEELAMPFTRMCRRLFYEGCWPTILKT